MIWVQAIFFNLFTALRQNLACHKLWSRSANICNTLADNMEFKQEVTEILVCHVCGKDKWEGSTIKSELFSLKPKMKVK